MHKLQNHDNEICAESAFDFLLLSAPSPTDQPKSLRYIKNVIKISFKNLSLFQISI